MALDERWAADRWAAEPWAPDRWAPERWVLPDFLAGAAPFDPARPAGLDPGRVGTCAFFELFPAPGFGPGSDGLPTRCPSLVFDQPDQAVGTAPTMLFTLTPRAGSEPISVASPKAKIPPSVPMSQ